jgi:hypothetical protein
MFRLWEHCQPETGGAEDPVKRVLTWCLYK